MIPHFPPAATMWLRTVEYSSKVRHIDDAYATRRR